MKLVTGIEAIQSGKRFRYRPPNNNPSHWMTISDGSISFTIHEFMMCSWQIEQEPREFWIYLSPENGAAIAYHADYAGADFKNDRWIRVREIEK